MTSDRKLKASVQRGLEMNDLRSILPKVDELVPKVDELVAASAQPAHRVGLSIQEQLLRSNEKHFRGGLVFKARRICITQL